MCMQWKCTLSLTHYLKEGLLERWLEKGYIHFPVEVRPLWFHVIGLREGVSEEVGVRTSAG